MQTDPLVFFSSAKTPRKNKSGGLGVNKRNRGYPAAFEFIERPLNINKAITFVRVAIGVEGTHSLRDSNSRRKFQLCDKSESDDNRIKRELGDGDIFTAFTHLNSSDAP